VTDKCDKTARAGRPSAYLWAGTRCKSRVFGETSFSSGTLRGVICGKAIFREASPFSAIRAAGVIEDGRTFDKVCGRS
jgi:hypothetical protein